MTAENKAPLLYDCCDHCKHDINDPPHDRPCPEGCPGEHDPDWWSSGPSLVRLDAGETG